MLRSSSILLYNGFDSNKPLCGTEHKQVYFVLQKQRLWAAIVQLDTLFSFLCTLALTDNYVHGCLLFEALAAQN